MSSSDNARDFAPGDDLPPACLSARRDVRRVQEVLGAAMAIGGFLVALFLINASTGFFQDDDVCHYNIAREGWHDAGKAWHNWGRPGYTLPTMVAAHFFGMYGCRVFSALQMMFVAYLAFRIARHLAPPVVGRAGPTNLLAALAPAFAPVMVWAQPLTMQLSLTTVLEVPSALYLTLAVWLYIRGNRAWSGVALSPLFITRYETLALVPIFALVAIADAINDWEQKRLATSDKPPGNSKEE